MYVAAWPAVLGMALVGFPGAVCIAARTTLLQDHSTDDQRGRIFALIFAVSALSLTVGAVTAGFLGDAIGIIEVLALQGGGYVVAGVMVLLLIGATERAEAPAVASDRGLVTPADGFSGRHPCPWRHNWRIPRSAGESVTSVAHGLAGPSTLTVGSPVPQRTMTARAGSSLGVGLAVDRTRRDPQEVAGATLDHLGPAGAGLDPHPPADDVQGRLVVAVVVPAGDRAGLGVDDAGPHPCLVHRQAARHPGRGVGRRQLVGADAGDGRGGVVRRRHVFIKP